MIRSMGLAGILGLMDEFTRDSGRTGSSMEKASTSCHLELKKKVIGKRASESTGRTTLNQPTKTETN